MKKIYYISIVFLCFVLLISHVFSQSFSTQAPSAADIGYSEEEFRRGVQAWYRGTFNEAIIQFEKALSYLPEQPILLDWLGKAYYRSGLEGTAIEQWKIASDLGYGGMLLQNKIEVVENRRVTGSDTEKTVRFVESGTFPGSSGEVLYFSQPTSILPNEDGSIWVIAYGSNELIRFDVNGLITSRIKGPLNGFDRPMDIVRQQNGNLLVSEYAGDRISILDSNGLFISYIGSKGRGDGQLLGPQYLAQDSSENIYVTDFGNGRVVVYDYTGQWLFNFGDFDSPTGITIIDDIVYVADSISGNISMYDTSGNFLDNLVEDNSFSQIESIRSWDNYILASDTNMIYAIDTYNGEIHDVVHTGNSPTRLTSAQINKNGTIVASDFFNSDILLLSRMNELVGGFFVQVERVYSDNFPNVTVELRVQNRNREPIVGLKDVNFLLTEEQRPVANQRLVGVADANDFCDITLLIDRNIATQDYLQAIDSAVREIASSMNSQSTLRIVSAGSAPVTEYEGEPSFMERFSSANLRTPFSQTPATDLAIRLSANDLINASSKRAIVYLTASSVNPMAFTSYALADSSSYLNNNGISFLVVNLDNKQLSPEINYIVNHTPGEEYFVFRPEGLSPLVQDVLDIPVGLYQFTYVSSLPTDFGSRFLPFEAEVYLMNRSGRDETGYFAPLE